MVEKLKYLSLFSGMGGLDYGLEKAGFDNLGCIEMDRDACELLRANRNWNIFEEDIRNISASSIKKKLSIKAGELDLIVGGPPCQSYSKSSFWAEGTVRGYGDARGKLIDHYLRFVEELLPKCFLIENVPGFTYSNQKGGLESVFRAIKRIKRKTGKQYLLSYKIINCVDYGVPQRRERFFLVATRIGEKFVFPMPTHSHHENVEGLQPYASVADAFEGLKLEKLNDNLDLGGKWADLLPCIPPGGNYQYFTSNGEGRELFEYRSRYWTFLLKLSPKEPSWTIQASPGSSTGPFHWENRKLSSRELARIQTIPDNISLNSNRLVMQRLIGNAVPSLIGEILGKEIKKQIFNLKIQRRYFLIPNLCTRIYRPRVKTNVPRNFL